MTILMMMSWWRWSLTERGSSSSSSLHQFTEIIKHVVGSPQERERDWSSGWRKREKEKNSLDRNISHFVFCGLLEVCSATATPPPPILLINSASLPLPEFAIKSGPPAEISKPRRRQEETNGKNNYTRYPQFILFLPSFLNNCTQQLPPVHKSECFFCFWSFSLFAVSDEFLLHPVQFT